MKKSFFVAIFLMAALVLTACGPKQSEFYFAVAETNQDSSWVYFVSIEKQGDDIVDAKWDAFNIAGDSDETFKGMSKYEASVKGLYDMTPAGDQNGKLWWHEQADLITKKLVETDNVNEREPIPAGASVKTAEFYSLAEKALASDPIPAGNYKDGYHFATLKGTDTVEAGKTKAFYNAETQELMPTIDYNTHSFGSFVVVNGSIVMAYFNNVFYGYRVKFDDAGKIVKQTVGDVTAMVIESTQLYKTKNQLGLSYGMAVVSGNLEYDAQAKLAGEYLVSNQKFPELNAKGKFDGVASLTITTDHFVQLLALVPAK